MAAIICQMADGEDWVPGAELQVERKELYETKEWLVAIQKKSAPLSPCKKTPIRQEPMDPPNSQRGESEAGHRENKADDCKTAMLPQSEGKRGTKVSEVDQVKHPLAGGQWEGLGTIRKGGEIRIEVWASGSPRIDSTDTQDRAAWSLVFPSMKCDLCRWGNKVCLGLKGITCGQCMRDQNGCLAMPTESEC